MATHPSILARKIPWTEEPGGLQSMESQRVRYNWATNTVMHGSNFRRICPKMLILVVISDYVMRMILPFSFIFLWVGLIFTSILSFIIKQKQWWYFHFKNKSLGKVIFMNHSPKKMTTLYKYTLVYLKFQQ